MMIHRPLSPWAAHDASSPVANRLVFVPPGFRIVGRQGVVPNVVRIDLRHPPFGTGVGIDGNDRAGMHVGQPRVLSGWLTGRIVTIGAEKDGLTFGIV